MNPILLDIIDTLENPKLYQWARDQSITIPLLRIHLRICTYRHRFHVYKVTLY